MIKSLKVIIQKYRKKMYRQLTYTLIAHKGRLAAKHYQQKEIQMKKKIGIEGLEVQTIADCYRVFRDKLKFPDYFSNNLNSFEECINDLSWFTEMPDFELVIYHSDCFIQKEPLKRKEVLDILQKVDLNYYDRNAKQKFIVILK